MLQKRVSNGETTDKCSSTSLNAPPDLLTQPNCLTSNSWGIRSVRCNGSGIAALKLLIHGQRQADDVVAVHTLFYLERSAGRPSRPPDLHGGAPRARVLPAGSSVPRKLLSRTGARVRASRRRGGDPRIPRQRQRPLQGRREGARANVEPAPWFTPSPGGCCPGRMPLGKVEDAQGPVPGPPGDQGPLRAPRRAQERQQEHHRGLTGTGPNRWRVGG